MKRKLFLTQLQGLGDTVLFSPHLLYLSQHFDLTVAVVNGAAYSFLKTIDPSLKLIKFSRKKDIFKWRHFETYDIAASPCCPGRAELLLLFMVKADRKISFYDKSLKWTNAFPYCTLPTAYQDHDFKNNITLVDELVKTGKKNILKWYIENYRLRNHPQDYVG